MPVGPGRGQLARTFAGADSIELALGTADIAFGDGSLAAIVKPSSTAGNQLALSITHTADNTAQAGIGLRAAAILSAQIGGTFRDAPTITVPAGAWALIGVSKATGTTAVRYHKYDYATKTASHENLGATVAGAAANATRVVEIGRQRGTTGLWNGDIAVAGVFNAVLSDANFESLALGIEAWRGLASLKGLWRLDQAAITTAVTDLSGGGATETAHTLTTVSAAGFPFWTPGRAGLIVPQFQAVQSAASW